MAQWCDDDGNVVKAVSAEQHALDNPGHVVLVSAKPSSDGEFMMLDMVCHHDGQDHWWDEQGVRQ